MLHDKYSAYVDVCYDERISTLVHECYVLLARLYETGSANYANWRLIVNVYSS